MDTPNPEPHRAAPERIEASAATPSGNPPPQYPLSLRIHRQQRHVARRAGSRATLFTDGRYTIQAPEEAPPGVRVRIAKHGLMPASWTRAAGATGASCGWLFRRSQCHCGAVPAAADGCRAARALDAATEHGGRLRAVKDAAEIETMREAAQSDQRGD